MYNTRSVNAPLPPRLSGLTRHRAPRIRVPAPAPKLPPRLRSKSNAISPQVGSYVDNPIDIITCDSPTSIENAFNQGHDPAFSSWGVGAQIDASNQVAGLVPAFPLFSTNDRRHCLSSLSSSSLQPSRPTPRMKILRSTRQPAEDLLVRSHTRCA
jgi:hypothetical protein